ncbi:hypothetical protein H7Y63_02975 [Polaromonas sp.]|nr:hypothetical protein [Candidatus Saccharibacteria bacterium]
MRVFERPVLGVVVGLALLANPVATFAAVPPVEGQQIRITATVQPMRYIIVDTSGSILQIISNTDNKDIVPSVYVGTILEVNQIPLTEIITNQEQIILKNKVVKPGVLYKRPALVVAPPKNMVLTLLSPTQK